MKSYRNFGGEKTFFRIIYGYCFQKTIYTFFVENDQTSRQIFLNLAHNTVLTPVLIPFTTRGTVKRGRQAGGSAPYNPRATVGSSPPEMS